MGSRPALDSNKQVGRRDRQIHPASNRLPETLIVSLLKFFLARCEDSVFGVRLSRATNSGK
jgi:hypothetical protein